MSVPFIPLDPILVDGVCNVCMHEYCQEYEREGEIPTPVYSTV